MARDFEQLIHPFFSQEGEAVGLGQGIGQQGLLFQGLLGSVTTVRVSAPLSPHMLLWELS